MSNATNASRQVVSCYRATYIVGFERHDGTSWSTEMDFRTPALASAWAQRLADNHGKRPICALIRDNID